MGTGNGKRLRLVGVAFGCLFGSLSVLFVVGELADDPGGATAAGLALLVVLPLVALALLAWFRPTLGGYVLAWLAAALVVVVVWFAVDPGGLRGFENAHGPVRAVSAAMLVPALALLGWRRPQLAGLLLVSLGLVPLLIASAATRTGSSSLAAVALPALIDGVIFLLAAAAHGTRVTPGTSVHSQGA